LKSWPKVLRRPVYDRPEDLIFNLSDPAWDAVIQYVCSAFILDTAHTSSLIAHPKDRVATLQDVQTLPFFQKTKFSALRETTAPFVPMLEGETDVGYFDSFDSAEDMAKYAEVFKKQRDVEAVQEKGLGNRNNWVSPPFILVNLSI
jgi:non-specific serine/threonine protein kinase